MSDQFKVGQKLIFVHSDARLRKPYEITIQKIGRKWLYTQTHRVDCETLFVDGKGYSSPGRCYLTIEAWHQADRLSRTWVAFRKELNNQWKTPAGVSVDDILEASKLLGFSIADEDSPL